MRVGLDKLQLSNYRSCIRTSFDLNRSLSAMIGPNGAGKTNVMHGILLLRKVLRVGRGRRSGADRGSACSVTAAFSVGKELTIQFRAKVHYATDEHNNDELVASEQEWHLGSLSHTNEWVHFPFLSVPWSRSEPRLSDFRELATYEGVYGAGWHFLAEGFETVKKNKRATAGKVASAIQKFLVGMTYYSASQFTDPSRSPIYFELEDGRLPKRGPASRREHLPFLHGLYSMWKDDSAQFAQYIDTVGAAGVGLVTGISFKEIETPANVYDVRIGGKLVSRESKRLLVIPQITIGRSTLSPNQLSEGTFKTLALLYFLLTDRSHLLLIEEPEVVCITACSRA